MSPHTLINEFRKKLEDSKYIEIDGNIIQRKNYDIDQDRFYANFYDEEAYGDGEVNFTINFYSEDNDETPYNDKEIGIEKLNENEYFIQKFLFDNFYEPMNIKIGF